MKSYFIEHEKEFSQPDQVKLKIIRLYNQKKANEAFQELRKGANFGIMAIEISKDQSASKKGNIGWLGVDQLSLPIQENLDEMEIGGVYGPFKGTRGFVILRFDGEKEGKLIEFDRVKNKIARVLSREKYENLLEEYVMKLRFISKIKINEPVFENFIESKSRN